MSQPDYPETVRCPECTHPYNPDSLTAQQRERANECPWCAPATESMTEYEESEWAILHTFNALRETACSK